MPYVDEAVHARLRAAVLEGDPERGEAALFAASDPAKRLIALYAVNLEIAKAWEAVSEPALGLIRLQWWREALDHAKAGEGVRRHDGAEALADLIAAAPGLAPLFEALIDAREKDFDEAPFADDAAFEAYLDATAGGIVQAALMLAAPEMAGEDVHALSRPLGRAWGRVGTLRALPFHLAKRRFSAPAGGVDAEALFSGGEKDKIAALKARLLTAARTDHAAAAAAFKRLLPDARPAALYGALIPSLVKKLAEADPFRDVVSLGAMARKSALTLAALRGGV